MTKLKRLIFFFLAAVILCYFVPVLFFPAAKHKIRNYLQNYFAAPIHLKKVRINLLAGNIILEKLTIENPEEFGRDNLLEIKEVIIHPKILSLIRKKPAVSITFNEPYLNLYRMGQEKTNWNSLWNKENHKPNGNRLILNNLLIKNGIICYTEKRNQQDAATAYLHGFFAHLKRYSTPLTRIKNIPLYTKIKGRAYLPTEPKGMLNFNAAANLEQEKFSFLANITMENICLKYFDKFYMKQEKSQVEITQGNFSLTGRVECIRNNIYTRPDVTVKNLRLRLTSNYTSGKLFELPVMLVVDFFDLYKEELKFRFEVKGTLTDPKFYLKDIIAGEISQVVSKSIVSTIIATPALLGKLGDELMGIEKTLKRLGITITTELKKGAATAIKPAKELIKGLKGK